MGLIKEFEELKCWQNAFLLTTNIYRQFENESSQKDYGYKNQLTRASVSIMNNITEGFGRSSSKDMRRFFEISASSCLEVKSMLHLGKTLNYFSEDYYNSNLDLLELTRAQILGFIRSIRRS